MASKQNQLAALLRAAKAGLDAYNAAMATILDKDWDEALAHHHILNMQDGFHRVKREREYVHDVLKDPTGKDDL